MCLVVLMLALLPAAAQAATFTVNSTTDAVDGNLGDPACATSGGVCTLRAAIQQANQNLEHDDIIVPAGTYRLTLPAPDDDTGAGGDLDVNDGDTIEGIDGAESTQVIQTIVDRVFDVDSGTPNNPNVVISGLRISGGRLGGIRVGRVDGGTSLTLADSTVDGNEGGGTDPGGGGISVVGETADSIPLELTLVRSTISGNEAVNGGGIWVGDAGEARIENSTISGNAATNGGGGLFTRMSNGSPEGRATVLNSTIAENIAPDGQGGGLKVDQGMSVTLEETIVADNVGGNCYGQNPPVSQGNNMDDGNTCQLGGNGDRVNTDPQLGPLLDNGGPTQTHAITIDSPALDAIPAGECPPPATDQRSIARPFGPRCDIGAFELVYSLTQPSLPDCSPSGSFTLRMDPAPGQDPVAFHYKVNGGPEQVVSSTSAGTATLSFPEGRRTLEYWGETDEGQDPNHQVQTALVDQTDPTLSVASDQGQDIYVITRTATVTVAAGDPLSGLDVDPTATNEAVLTSSRGAKTATWTAVDLCENTTTRQFDYTVLAPELGERAVVEPLGPDVEVRPPAGDGARASQKGADFEPVTEPREIPIGTTIDARDGDARITSSRSLTETEIQDGTFAAGLFQVLQRRTARNGLTTLQLKGSNFRNCEVGKASAEPGADTARLSRRARRRLRGSARGRFRTRGRRSAATVRGTDWEVIDRCDGTLTKVERGIVAVRDFRLQRTIELTDGERYLARAEPPAPVLGRRANVKPVKGKVFIKLPRRGKFARASQKGSGFVRLRTARSIPVRSILDTRRGTVALQTARNRKGRLQSGRFSRGVFQVLQSRKRRAKGLTTLKMKGKARAFRRCGGRSSSSDVSAEASLSRRAIRRLRARARGRYRTRGRRSAATVRGTVWTTTDSCAGTLTKVRRGKVTVRDFRLRKTIVLRRGKSYLARAG